MYCLATFFLFLESSLHQLLVVTYNKQLCNYKDPAMKKFHSNVALIQKNTEKKNQVYSDFPHNINFCKIDDH